MATLRTECDAIAQAELNGEIRMVMTGPELEVGPFVLFSTSVGDAWLLDPNEGLAMRLVWQSQRVEPAILDSSQRISIDWDGSFELLGEFFSVRSESSDIGSRVIAGYPLGPLRKLIDQALDVHRRVETLFGQSDAVEIDERAMVQMVKRGHS